MGKGRRREEKASQSRAGLTTARILQTHTGEGGKRREMNLSHVTHKREKENEKGWREGRGGGRRC
jgi:hypothetical protein